MSPEAGEETKWQGKIAFHTGSGNVSALELLPNQGQSTSVNLLAGESAKDAAEGWKIAEFSLERAPDQFVI